MFIGLILSLFLAHGYWPDAAIEKSKNFDPKKDTLGFNDPYEASLLGSIKSMWFSFQNVDRVDLHAKKAFKKPVELTYSLNQEKKFRRGERRTGSRIRPRIPYYVKLKSPLLIYIPGIYADADDSSGRRAIAQYEEKGYHIFVLPNPWSKEYIKANPNGAKPGDILSEAYALRQLMDQVIDFIGEEYITDVELMGASYGAYIAAIMQSLEDKDKPLFSKTTLLGPPIDFRYAIPYLDEQLKKYSLEESDFGFWETIKMGIEYLFAKELLDVADEYRDKAKPFTLYKGFKSGLISAIKTYSNVHGKNWIPDFSNRQEQKRWENELYFSSYYKKYAPKLKDVIESEFAFLRYWVNESLKQGHKVRILTADDDFLNPPKFPTKALFRNTYPERVYLSLPKGGHLGFIAFPWYNEFKEIVWPGS